MKTMLAVLALVLAGCSTPQMRTSWKGDVSPVKQALMRRCQSTKDPVSLAVYGEAHSVLSDPTFYAHGFDPRRVENGATKQIQTTYEQQILEYMANASNFHLVDRTSLDQIFQELQLSISGAISPTVRLRIGQLTGANVLLLFDSTYYPSNYTRIIVSRLIDLENGEVLASQSIQTARR